MRYDNRTFQSEDVVLDNNEYSDCAFNDCTLIFRGGVIPRFDNIDINGCRLDFQGAALNTISFMTLMVKTGSGFADLIDILFDEMHGIHRDDGS